MKNKKITIILSLIIIAPVVPCNVMKLMSVSSFKLAVVQTVDELIAAKASGII